MIGMASSTASPMARSVRRNPRTLRPAASGSRGIPASSGRPPLPKAMVATVAEVNRAAATRMLTANW